MKTILASLILMTTAASASAQDWAGGYFGVTLGKGSGDLTYPTMPFSPGREIDTAGVYGIFAGYNFQQGNLVYGGELAYQKSDLTYQVSVPAGFDRLVDLKARVGFATGNLLVYGVVAYGTNSAYVSDATQSGDGTAYGLGVDYQLNDRFILGAEYLTRDMRTEATPLLVELDSDISTLSLRLGMKF